MKFDQRFREQLPAALLPSLEHFEELTATLAEASARTLLWRPLEESPAALGYGLDMLRLMYLSKFSILCQSLIRALNAESYFVYGLIGRSLIEHTALLRYYVHEKMEPLFEEASAIGHLPQETLQALASLMKRHLLGHRFDWEEYLADVFVALERPGSGHLHEEPQVNILTCLQKWAREDEAIRVTYALFCDLVHPNLGSTLLVSRRVERRVGVGGQGGQPLGLEIVKRTFVDLLTLSREVQQELALVKSWQDDLQGRGGQDS